MMFASMYYNSTSSCNMQLHPQMSGLWYHSNDQRPRGHRNNAHNCPGTMPALNSIPTKYYSVFSTCADTQRAPNCNCMNRRCHEPHVNTTYRAQAHTSTYCAHVICCAHTALSRCLVHEEHHNLHAEHCTSCSHLLCAHCRNLNTQWRRRLYNAGVQQSCVLVVCTWCIIDCSNSLCTHNYQTMLVMHRSLPQPCTQAYCNMHTMQHLYAVCKNVAGHVVHIEPPQYIAPHTSTTKRYARTVLSINYTHNVPRYVVLKLTATYSGHAHVVP
jgi:hypothetical protein